MLKLRRAGKAQSKTIRPDWLAMGAGKRTIKDDIIPLRETQSLGASIFQSSDTGFKSRLC